ncbi:hypothetical protein L1887_37905 [Cichorium endivia]|nr:hypothetical protein L1887_37905 [Cichorium endivia]
MHEFQMKNEDLANLGDAQDAYVICKVFEKSGIGSKNGAQYGAPFEEKDWDDDDDENDDERSTLMVGVLVNPDNVNRSSMKNIASSEPGPSTVTPSAKVLDPNASTSTITYWDNEKLAYVPVNDDVMSNHGSITSLEKNNTQEVEDRKGKKVMTVPVNEYYWTFQELAVLNDIGQDDFNMFSIDGFADDDNLDAYFTADDDYSDAFQED